MTTTDQSGQSTPSSVVPTEDGQQTDTPNAWLIRGGRNREREDFALEHGVAGMGWNQVPDLTGVSSLDETKEILRSVWPEANTNKRRASIYAGHLWTLRARVRTGDLVVMPLRTSQIALGIVTREYWYRDVSDHDERHVVSVDWKRPDVPRTDIGRDLLKSLSGQQTIYSIRSNDGPWRLQQLMETGRDPGARVEPDDDVPDVSILIEQFRVESGYPTEAHEEQKRLREEWALKLAPHNIESFSRLDLTAIASHGTWSSGMYVYPSVQGVMKWIRQLDDTDYARTIDSLHYLCWDEEELSVRYDNLLDPRGLYRIRGLADETTSRTLAICHPDVFLPIGIQTGKWGRERMLQELGLPDADGLSHGERIMDANNRLREHLEPHFGDDTLGMGAFLGWLLQQDSLGSPMEDPLDSPIDLTELATEMLVRVEFLEDIVSLLDDKGQVILYGPPGTGKTYLARELAKALAPDESCRALVQFHPSTSYEDFFEGYRPAGTGDGGGIRYELTPGPLARMAVRASEAPDRQHVMIIDEINRGNLPRVLGELLFLLEYRDESVNTLYRPDQPFSLPENLWFIGTMNTADRSIALVDAALRRRFHFVPFFPDSGPMAGLLGRWLKREDEPVWVGELVGCSQPRSEGRARRLPPATRAEPLHEGVRLRGQRTAPTPPAHLGVQHRAVHRGPVLRRSRAKSSASGSAP